MPPLAFRLASAYNVAIIIDTAHDNETLGAISLDAYWEMVNTATTYQAKMQGMSDAEVSDFVHGLFDFPSWSVWFRAPENAMASKSTS